jgi:hypothetical protein
VLRLALARQRAVLQEHGQHAAWGRRGRRQGRSGRQLRAQVSTPPGFQGGRARYAGAVTRPNHACSTDCGEHVRPCFCFNRGSCFDCIEGRHAWGRTSRCLGGGGEGAQLRDAAVRQLEREEGPRAGLLRGGLLGKGGA